MEQFREVDLSTTETFYSCSEGEQSSHKPGKDDSQHRVENEHSLDIHSLSIYRSQCQSGGVNQLSISQTPNKPGVLRSVLEEKGNDEQAVRHWNPTPPTSLVSEKKSSKNESNKPVPQPRRSLANRRPPESGPSLPLPKSLSYVPTVVTEQNSMVMREFNSSVPETPKSTAPRTTQDSSTETSNESEGSMFSPVAVPTVVTELNSNVPEIPKSTATRTTLDSSTGTSNESETSVSPQPSVALRQGDEGDESKPNFEKNPEEISQIILKHLTDIIKLPKGSGKTPLDINVIKQKLVQLGMENLVPVLTHRVVLTERQLDLIKSHLPSEESLKVTSSLPPMSAIQADLCMATKRVTTSLPPMSATQADLRVATKPAITTPSISVEALEKLELMSITGIGHVRAKILQGSGKTKEQLMRIFLEDCKMDNELLKTELEQIDPKQRWQYDKTGDCLRAEILALLFKRLAIF